MAGRTGRGPLCQPGCNGASATVIHNACGKQAITKEVLSVDAMNHNSVSQALAALSKAYSHRIDDPPVDVVLGCVGRLKEFLLRSRQYCLKYGIPLVNPFVDPTGYLNRDLPHDVAHQLRSLLRNVHPTRIDHRVVPLYIRYLCFRSELQESMPGEQDLYAPFHSVLCDGIDVYLKHTGGLSIAHAFLSFSLYSGMESPSGRADVAHVQNDRAKLSE